MSITLDLSADHKMRHTRSFQHTLVASEILMAAYNELIGQTFLRTHDNLCQVRSLLQILFQSILACLVDVGRILE